MGSEAGALELRSASSVRFVKFFNIARQSPCPPRRWILTAKLFSPIIVQGIAMREKCSSVPEYDSSRSARESRRRYGWP